MTAALRHAALNPDESVAGGKLRRIVLDGQCIDYRMVRARRRTIGMQVDLDGLTVRAPRWVSLGEIEAALAERSGWILRTLAEWRTRRRDVLPREWKTGAPILLPRRRAVARGVSGAPPGDPPRHVRPDRAASTRARRAPVATFVGHWLGGGVRLLAPRVAHVRARGRERDAAGQAIERAQRMGKLQPARRDPPQLAARATARRARRIRRRARGRAPGRAQSLGALLGSRRAADAGTRGARRALEEWTALLAA